MKKVNTVSESRVAGLLQDLQQEVEKATGMKSGRARFYGFQLLPSLKALIAEALTFFKEGQFNNAEVAVKAAKDRLISGQRGFARNSVLDENGRTSFFTRLILDLPHLDQDIEQAIESRRSTFRDCVSKVNFDLDEASELSWALRDAIKRAESEQEARIQNRELQKKKGLARKARATEQLRDEQSREAQLRFNAEQAARRAELADQLAQEFQLP